MGALGVKPILIYYTATAHKRINVKGNCFMLKDCFMFTENFYPLNLISILKSKISYTFFTSST